MASSGCLRLRTPSGFEKPETRYFHWVLVKDFIEVAKIMERSSTFTSQAMKRNGFGLLWAQTTNPASKMQVFGGEALRLGPEVPDVVGFASGPQCLGRLCLKTLVGPIHPQPCRFLSL